jgi:dTDP-4-dehydrorhamnose reductase
MTGDTTRYAIVGAGGQLAFDLARTCPAPRDLALLTRADLDLLDRARVGQVLGDLRPQVVLNGAAYNQVDRAEDERERAFAVNAEAVGTLAETCQAIGATLVHFSTDYVFDGRQTSPYLEGDPPNPINAYGESKLAGERLAQARCARAFVIRVCGLYGIARRAGGVGTNFVETMLRLAAAAQPIRVVADQVLTPSYTVDVSRAVWRILAGGRPGLYHVTNGGATSWYDFARSIFRLSGLTPDLTPVTAAQFGARARRPAYSVLAHGGLAALGADDLRAWPEALALYLDERTRPPIRRDPGPTGS